MTNNIEEALTEARKDFAPCPLCHQYSHSIGEDDLAKAFRHFETMYSHPMRGTPMGFVFDEQTRWAAQVLMAAARQAADTIPIYDMNDRGEKE